jgi:hypothetical protein
MAPPRLVINATRLPDLITDGFEAIEILSFEIALGQRERFVRQAKRQGLGHSLRFEVKSRINVGCRVQIASVSHAVIGNPKAIDKHFPR